MNLQAQCGLGRLPPELRNVIYHYIFGDGAVEGQVQLHDVHDLAPPCDLLITCRLFNKEAAGMHQKAYENFWKNNTFKVRPQTFYDEPYLTTKRIAHMTHVIEHLNRPGYFNFLELRPTPGCGRYNYVFERRSSKGYHAFKDDPDRVGTGAWSIVDIHNEEDGLESVKQLKRKQRCLDVGENSI